MNATLVTTSAGLAMREREREREEREGMVIRDDDGRKGKMS